ncbi:hypothetical protein K437DRAFT_171882 [Tilletiaria anomala UBC 951]|uniref:Uncharacterized protein n=1 Tax=Tilletiaria anomala (strain ATCC 24038 / CBS 436.72 / UBC 951) TaxID=1037660 RepID=A0A066VMT5_TILAU|nr:uncharacterized protein K437DRAFT_171882 [Tilletiaria anomala UBC 951]KDN41603.1 hypothetical protein K437DRAFT_171882 [Tilletiaria anomala UBC 951]
MLTPSSASALEATAAGEQADSSSSRDSDSYISIKSTQSSNRKRRSRQTSKSRSIVAADDRDKNSHAGHGMTLATFASTEDTARALHRSAVALEQAQTGQQARRSRDRSRSWTWHIGSGFTPASTNAPPSPRDSSPERGFERPTIAAPSTSSSGRRRDEGNSSRPRKPRVRGRANSSASSHAHQESQLPSAAHLSSGSGRGSRSSTRPSTPSSSAAADYLDLDLDGPTPAGLNGAGIRVVPPPRVRSSPHLGELQRLAHSFSPIHTPFHSSTQPSSSFDYSNAAAAVAAANAGYFGAAAVTTPSFLTVHNPHLPSASASHSDGAAIRWLEAARAHAATLGLQHTTQSPSQLPLNDVPPPYSPPQSSLQPGFLPHHNRDTMTAPPSDDEQRAPTDALCVSLNGSDLRRRRRHAGDEGDERGALDPNIRPEERQGVTEYRSRRRRRAASHDGASMSRMVSLTPVATGRELPAPGQTGDLGHRRATATSLGDDLSPDSMRSDADSHFDGVTSGGEGADMMSEFGGDGGAASAFAGDSKAGGAEDDVLVLLILLHPLRLLAAVPGLLGTFWLLRNSVVLALQQQDLRRLGDRRDPGPLDFFVSCLWSLGTAFYALSFTTLLLRRWLLYYSLLPSLIPARSMGCHRVHIGVLGRRRPVGDQQHCRYAAPGR